MFKQKAFTILECVLAVTLLTFFVMLTIPGFKQSQAIKEAREVVKNKYGDSLYCTSFNFTQSDNNVIVTFQWLGEPNNAPYHKIIVKDGVIQTFDSKPIKKP